MRFSKGEYEEFDSFSMQNSKGEYLSPARISEQQCRVEIAPILSGTDYWGFATRV